MLSETLEMLIHRYTAKADYHGYLAILGEPKYKEYHARQERKYNRLIIEVGTLYLEEYGKPE